MLNIANTHASVVLVIFYYYTGADPGKNLTMADFVCPPPRKIFEIQSILKQYLMHFEAIFLSRKDKISVILRYFKKM